MIALAVPGVAQAAQPGSKTPGRTTENRDYGVEVGADVARQLDDATLTRLRASGVAFLVVRDHRALGAAGHARLVSLARSARLQLVEPVAPPRTPSELAALRASCAATRATVNRCAVAAPTKAEADAWLRRGRVDFVVRRFRSIGAFDDARAYGARGSSLIVVVDSRDGVAAAPWRDAIASVAAEQRRSLALGLPEREWQSRVTEFLSLVRTPSETPSSQPPASAPRVQNAPTQPTGLRLTANGLDFLTVHWEPSTAPRSQLVGYDLYLNGSLTFRSRWEEATFTGLRCGTSYLVEVEAVDSAGRRSTRASATFTTMWGCVKPAPAPAPEPAPTPGPAPTAAPEPAPAPTTQTQDPPSTTTVEATSSTSTATSSASADTATAGAVAAASTDSTAPSAPTGLVQTISRKKAARLTWRASTDAVGVTGYGIYVGTLRVATTTRTEYDFDDLNCGSALAVAVDAVDAAGNRSAKTPFVVTTDACNVGGDKAAPSAPTGLAATSASGTSVSFAWTASTDDTGVAGYGVYRNGTLLGTTSGTSYTATALTCGQSYSFAVDAFDAAGNRSGQATATFAAAACPDTAPPTAPSGLMRTAATATSVSLAWAASSDAVGVTGYGVYRDGSYAGSASGTSYTVSGLSCGQSYAFAVDAYDAAGNRSSRATATFATASCADTTPPTTPSGLTRTAATATSVSLSWSASSDAVGVTGYGVYRNNSLVVTTSGTTYIATGLACGQSYAFAVDAVDAAGNRSGKTTATFATAACADTTPPTTPAGLIQTGRTATSVSLAWTASSDAVGVTGYGVYRNGSLAGTASGTTYTVTGLACGQSHEFAVDAVDAAGNRSGKATATIATDACPDMVPPTTPTGLVRTTLSATSVSLSWSASSDAVGVTGYGVYRNGSLIGSTATTSYAATGLTCGTSYTFEVDAVDGAGNRSGKASLLVTTTPCPDTTAPTAPSGLRQSGSTTTSLGVAWDASTDNVGVTGYRVLVNGSVAATPTSTSVTATGLTCGTSYSIAVDAVDAAGNRSAQATATMATASCPTTPPPNDTQAPSVPQGLRVAGTTATSVTLAWNASTDNVGVTGYRLYNGNTVAGTTTQLTYTFTGLQCGTPYSLSVVAYDAAGNASYRPEAVAQASTAACTADTQAPSVPQGLRVTGSTSTSVTMAWNASTDNVGVTGYRLYNGNTVAGTTTQLTYTFTGLQCGTSFALSVEAYDAAGNASYRPEAVAQVATAACTGGADTTPPTTPASLTSTGSAQTSVSLFWNPAIDNVAVTGYGVYIGASRVATTTATTYVVSGLTCGTSYTLGVDAVDAAGNRSTRAQVTASTAACPPPTGGLAQVFLSPSGSDSSACSQAAPCRSLDRAYRVAAPGATVELAGGSYGGQTVNADASKTSLTDVVFRPAAGATVSVGSLQMRGAHLELRDMTIDQVDFQNEANDVTLRNVVNRGMWWVGSSNISIIGGEIACGTCAYHSHMQNAGSTPPRNIVFDGVYFHDWHSQAGEHVECLQILGGDGITIRNSTFKNCGTGNGGLGATAALHLQAYGSGPVIKNVLLENNFFYASGNPYVIQGEDFENFDMRYNSLAGPILLYNGPSAGTGMDFVGNVLKASPCTAQNNAAPINWRYNVIQGGTCGPTDKNATSGFVSAASDLHLAAGSAAINAGDPASYPGRDIDGQTRPGGAAPDAGADETGSSASPTPPADGQAPTAPTGVAAAGTQTAVTLSWSASTDDVGVTGYGRYLGSARVSTGQETSYTFTGLVCGTRYAFAVDAVDAAGNRSAKAQVTASTAACSTSPPPADTQAPSVPGGLAASGTQTSVTLSWSASSDNVGVTGYGRYLGTNLVSSGTGTSHTFLGLACGTSYSLGVDAYDAAGNRSARGQVTASTSACSAPSPPPVGAGTANLWLDPNGGSCTRQSVPGSYADTQACASMQAALNAALAGDTVGIVDGTYRGQSISGTKAVTFRASGPGRPSFGQLVSAAENLTVQGILVENRDPQPLPFCGTWILDYTLFVCAAGNTYDNVIVDGMHHPSGDSQRRGGIQLNGSGRNFVFKNGVVRGVWDSKGFQGGADNMVLDNNLWHDIKLTGAGAAAGVHNECAYIGAGNNQVWRRNRFMYCPIMAMFFANYAGGPAFSGVLIENNLFTHAVNNESGNWHDGSSFVIPNGTSGQNQVNNWVIRYNTFEVAPLISRTPGTGDDNGSALFYGNVGGSGGCGNPEWRHSYNVGQVCGGTGDVSVPNAVNSRNAPNVAPFYVNAPGGDFHLKAGVAAVNRADGSRYPSMDNDGKARPVGGMPDAGAYEFG